MEYRLSASNTPAEESRAFWYGPKHFYATGAGKEAFYERIWFPPQLSRAKPWYFWIGVSRGGRVRNLAVDGEVFGMRRAERPADARIAWYRSAPVPITVSIYNGEQKVGIRGGMFSFRATGSLRACFITNDPDGVPSATAQAFERDRFGVTRDTLGSSILTPDAIEVGSSHVFRLTYTTGPAGIAAGGGFLAAVKWGLFPRPVWPGLDTSNDPGFLKILAKAPFKVSAGRPVKFRVAEVDFGTIGFDTRDHLVRVELLGGRLEEGDQVVFELGSAAEPVTVNQTFPYAYREVVQARWYTPTVPFKVLVDSTGKGVFLPLAERNHHSLAVRARNASRWHVWAPSMGRSGGKALVRAHALDEYNNRCADTLKGRLSIRTTIPGFATKAVSAAIRANGISAGVELPRTPAVVRVEVRDPAGRTLGVSNPIRLGKPVAEGRLFWGEIHGHCEMCDGLGKVDDYFAHAKDVAGLDFTSLTDHAEYMTDAQWATVQARSNAWNRPHEFVTLIGFEWGDTHRNIYTVKARQPLYRSNWIKTISIDRLHKVLKGRTDCMLVPHHTLYTGYGYEGKPKPELEPLIEVYSMWGNSEYPKAPHQDKDFSQDDVISLLKRGFRFGFICGSDNHDGRPGLSGQGARVKSRYGNLTFQAGLTAVYCKELTRPAVFEALRRRRSYGTTGARIILQVRVNGAFMGSSIRRRGKTGARVEVEVVGTAPIQRVDVVKNGDTVYTRSGGAEQMSFAWEDASSPSAGGTDFYYVRVSQADGEIAWSSPVWID